MRNNQPVTGVEHLLRPGESIVSKTDLQGNIVYVNPYFVEVSGFSEKELMGAPQNIIRHPDMPPEAFADLWVTLKQGIPWTGLVKNRCKNGDHYWVKANATPVREGGQVVGYMSVRTIPGRAQVNATEAVYRQFRAGRAQGLAIHRGAVVRTGLARQLAALQDMSLATLLRVGMSGLIALMLAMGVSAVPGTWVHGTG